METLQQVLVRWIISYYNLDMNNPKDRITLIRLTTAYRKNKKCQPTQLEMFV